MSTNKPSDLSDRELLEMAAKAAGMRYVFGEVYKLGDSVVDCSDMLYVTSENTDESPVYWNPLTDDGDALRLAVKLGLCIEFGYCMDDAPIVRCGPQWERDNWPQAANFPDSYAATRLAITRAAAELGKAMP